LFAIIAATIIRTFAFEAYTIPTPSMEGSMLTGDYLFVSKLSYGPKLPQTPISFPFAHHTLPWTDATPSYVEWFTMPHMRLPGFGSVEHNDIVVFNYPEGDTVLADVQSQSYYAILQADAMRRAKGGVADWNTNKANYIADARNNLIRNHDILVRPVDKRENYIKRCVALPGDVLRIVDKQVIVNDVAAVNPEEMQFQYFADISRSSVDIKELKEDFGIYDSELVPNPKWGNGVYILSFDENEVAKLRSKGVVLDLVAPQRTNNGLAGGIPLFPNDPHPAYNGWGVDNYGPITIPAEGATVELTEETMPLYRRIIDVYEYNDLEERADGFYINGEKATSYTFKQNYYWLMGDNRHNSQDSRFWGFVPQDHVVGKAVLIWMSSNPDPDMGVRWDRIFNSPN